MSPGFVSEQMLPRPIRILLIANVAVFLVDFVTRGAYALDWLCLDPGRIVHEFQLWRLVSYMFVHDITPPFWHILINMLMLWMFGTPVAHAMGERRFWWFYMLSGAFAGLCSLVFYAVTGNPSIVIGASGAIFALMVAFARFFPTQQFLIFFLFPVQAKYAVFIFGGIELLAITSNDRIAHVAHLGGALFAWGFLRWDIQGFNPWEAWRSRQRKQGLKKKRREEEKLQEAMTDIDPILEKISRHGMQSLTREEKEKLDRVSELKRNRRGNVVDIEDYRQRK
jgi:membrane associated rhomboid family serine protease